MTQASKANTNESGFNIRTIEEFLAYALVIEIEAEERYRLLAEQMEVHNNPEIATLFSKLAKIEGIHADEIRKKAEGYDLPELHPWTIQWEDAESPESAPLDGAHYLMREWHALQLALQAEKRAHYFFDQLAQTTGDAEIKSLAQEYAEDELEHVRLVEEWIEKVEKPKPGWDDDLDPPNYQE